ncbi:MAG: HEAT repeat domain-containing protein [Sphingomonadaceae bacterium]
MILGRELASWLGDGARQSRARQRISTFGRAWHDGPVSRRIATALAALPAATAETVAAAVADLFADDRWLAELLDGIAGEMRADPFFEPPFAVLQSEIHSGLMVYDDARVSIAAGVTGAAQLAAKKNGRRAAASINFPGNVIVLKILASGGAYFSFWKAPPTSADFTAAAAPRCAPEGGRYVGDGETLVIDGRRQSYVIEHAASDLVVLQANVKCGQAPLAAEYDADSHELVGVSAANDADSRVQMIATFLRLMDREDAFEAIAAFADDPSFFVRWHVMRELLGLDAEAALPMLEKMAARDPHPDVRAAARITLDQLGELPAERKEAA